MTIRIPTNEIYYKTQTFFAKNILPALPNDDRAWAKGYSEWLKEQGAIIVEGAGRGHRHPSASQLRAAGALPRVKTSLGVAPFYDFFEFEKDSDATMFVLRWA
jgi:hypothetical protein